MTDPAGEDQEAMPSAEPALPADEAMRAAEPTSATEGDATSPPRKSTIGPSAKLSKFGAFVEWFTRSRALRATQEALTSDPQRSAHQQHARAALEVAQRIRYPVEPLSGDPTLLALEAFSQATYWALAARVGEAPATRADAWEHLEERELNKLEQPDPVRSLFCASDAERGEQDPVALALALRDMERLAKSLVAEVSGAATRLASLRAQRGLRLGTVAILITVLGTWGIFRISRGANLATLATWRTSSTLNNCTPETHKCEGKDFPPFFCTAQESAPWIEYDFGARRRVAKVIVTNREDCCKERAVPLLVEISDDRKTWKKVGGISKAFDEATISFPPVSTRYLRLRVPKQTILHLNDVRIYR